MEKQCCRCKQSKPIAEFGKNKRIKDGLQRYCKECGRKSDKAHYRSNPHRKSAIKKNNKETNERNRVAIYEYLKEHPCVDCGENDPIVLEFDHIGEKHKTISVMIRDAYTLDRIFDEIAQCEVRCANCHKRKTAKQFGWWKGGRDASTHKEIRSVSLGHVRQ